MRVAALVVVIAACGDNQQPVEIVVPNGTPAFVGYKAGGAWHVAEPTDRGYRVDTVGGYQFVFVCSDGQDFAVEEVFADTSDGDQELLVSAPQIEPCATARRQLATGRVSGTVAQPGTVQVGAYGMEGLTANWSYELEVALGRQDLVFRPETGAMPVIRRDLEIGPGDNLQPRIDLASEGITLDRTPLMVLGTKDGAGIDATTTLVTANGIDLQLAASATPLLLPADALRSGERQYVEVSIFEPDADNGYADFVELAADAKLVARVQPPPVLTYAATELGEAVTWQHGPVDAVGYEIVVSNPGSKSIMHGVATATATMNHTLDLSVDRDAPGFLEAWRPLWSRDLASSARAFQIAAARDRGCYETLLVDVGRSTTFAAPRSRCWLRR